MTIIFAVALALLSSALALRQTSQDSAQDSLEVSQDEIFTPEEYEKMIADYRADWEKHGVKVEVCENVSDLAAKAYLPWKTPLDKSVDFNMFTNKEDRPRCKEAAKCQEVTLEDVVPYLKNHPYFYHGGDIKVDSFAAGIDFSKGKDQITGPAFFATHNIFNALLYGFKALWTWGEMITDLEIIKTGKYHTDYYRIALEIAIEHLDQCKGLVADMAFMKKAAELGRAKVAEWMETQCGGHKCSFIAMNWNEDGKLGSGKLPYEFRLLPGSEKTCGLKFDKVIMVKTGWGEKFWDVLMDPQMQAASARFFDLDKISKGEQEPS